MRGRPGRAGEGNDAVIVQPAGVDVAVLYAAHRAWLIRLAVLLVDDTASAEDVVQDAFVGLHRNAHRLRDPEAAVGYLRAATVNGARSALRRRRTARGRLHLVDAQPHEPADASTLLADEHAQVLAAVRTLPQRDQEVLALRYWGGLTEAQIAETLGVSTGTVKSTASRAVSKLEKLLEAQS